MYSSCPVHSPHDVTIICCLHELASSTTITKHQHQFLLHACMYVCMYGWMDGWMVLYTIMLNREQVGWVFFFANLDPMRVGVSSSHHSLWVCMTPIWGLPQHNSIITPFFFFFLYHHVPHSLMVKVSAYIFGIKSQDQIDKGNGFDACSITAGHVLVCREWRGGSIKICDLAWPPSPHVPIALWSCWACKYKKSAFVRSASEKRWAESICQREMINKAIYHQAIATMLPPLFSCFISSVFK